MRGGEIRWGCWRCEWNNTGPALTTMMGFDMLCCGVCMNECGGGRGDGVSVDAIGGECKGVQVSD